MAPLTTWRHEKLGRKKFAGVNSILNEIQHAAFVFLHFLNFMSSHKFSAKSNICLVLRGFGEVYEQ